MNLILDASPELSGIDPEDLASKMRESITTGDSDIKIGVTGVDVVTGGHSSYLVASVRRHPDVLKDRTDLMHTLRGMGGVALGGNGYSPHVTVAVYYGGGVPRGAVAAVEAELPNSFTVGPAVVDVVPSILRRT